MVRGGKPLATQLTTPGSSSLVTTDDEMPPAAAPSYLAPIVVSAILLVAHFPMLFQLGKDLWSREHYQFYPFLIPVSAFLMWEGFGRLKGPVQAGNQIICFILVLISGLMLVTSSLVGSGTLAALATLLTIATAIYGIGGWTLFKELFPGWVILFLAVPPPFKLDEQLITYLQLWVARATGMVLDIWPVEHIIEGAKVLIPGRNLMVEEACSGIHSLFSTLFCALGLALWARRGVIHTVVLLLLAVYWVLLGNLLRILAIVLAEVMVGYDLAAQPQHEILSIVIFIGLLGLVVSTDRLLLFFSPWAQSLASSAANKAKSTGGSVLSLVPELNRSWVASWAIGLLFALIAAFQFWVVGREIASSSFNRPSIEIAEIGLNGFPERILGSRRMQFHPEKRDVKNINGENSQIWYFMFNGKYEAIVSLDYTFTGWHDLTVCYRNNGWNIDKRTVDGKETETGVADPFVRLDLSKRHTGQKGLVYFALFEEDGKRVEPPSRSTKLFQERLDVILNRIYGRSVTGMTAPTYQVQLCIQSFADFSDQEKALAEQFFREIEGQVKVLVAKYRKEKTKSAAPTEPSEGVDEILGDKEGT
jgi:exosortase